MKTAKYMVVQSCGTGEEHPKYNGVSLVKPCDTVEEALKVVEQCAKDYSEYIGRELKKGDALNSSGEPCRDGEWAEHYYSESGLSLWVRGTSDNWERTEVFEWNTKHKQYIRVCFT